jgi:hypothetical protein
VQAGDQGYSKTFDAPPRARGVDREFSRSLEAFRTALWTPAEGESVRSLLLPTVLSLALVGCGLGSTDVSNETITSYAFLEDMYHDDYFPNHLVDRGREILLELCAALETSEKLVNRDVYQLTHRATEKFNQLAMEFESQGSEIETVARDNIGKDIAFILTTYGYDLDIEEAIAPRDW